MPAGGFSWHRALCMGSRIKMTDHPAFGGGGGGGGAGGGDCTCWDELNVSTTGRSAENVSVPCECYKMN